MADRHTKYFPFYDRALQAPQKLMLLKMEDIRLNSQVISNDASLLNALVALEEKDLAKTVKIVEQLQKEINSPLAFSRINPYGTYVLEDTRSTEDLLVFLSRTKRTEFAKARAAMGFREDGTRLSAWVTAYDYSTIISSMAYMDKQGYVVMDSVEGKLSYTSSSISKEWWETLLDEKPLHPNALLSSNSSTAERHDGGEYFFAGERQDEIFDVGIAELKNKMPARGVSLNPAGDTKGRAIEHIVENMMKAEQARIKGVPCLAGLSGVAKSAVVKNIAKKNNWRMIDFRAAFLHRLDMEGLQYLTDAEGEDFYSYQDYDVYEKFSRSAYFGDFFKCSDQYQDYALQMVSKLEAIKTATVDGPELDEQKKMKAAGTLAGIDKVIEHYKKESRPVVLFFDEIVRAPLKIMNLFTIMLDEKSIGPLNFKRAKMVAAANTPHGMANIEDGASLFVGQEVNDPAIHERLKIIQVHPDDVYPSWLDYIKRSGWDQDVIDFCTERPEAAYGMDILNDTSTSSDQKAEAIYPTFRAWEQVSAILKAARNPQRPVPVFPETLTGLLGMKWGTLFINVLIAKGDIEMGLDSLSGYSPEDKMGCVLDSNLETGTPTGLFGPSGLGKTARVKKMVQSKGYDMMTIQLSQKTLSDLMGAPSLVASEAYLMGDLASELDPKMVTQLTAISKDIGKDIAGMPALLTSRASDGAINDKIRHLRKRRAVVAAANENLPPDQQQPLPKLVLFFDECNRIPDSNKAVQSSLFEAISDNRFAGVDFEPGEIAVVAAANVNWEMDDKFDDTEDFDEAAISAVYGDKVNYSGTQKIGSALRLRLCSVDKKQVDIEDAKATREFIMTATKPDGTQSFHPVIQEYFASLSDQQVKLLMKSVEWKNEQANVPSIRSFSSLSGYLATSPEDMTGAFFFPTKGMQSDFVMDRTSSPEKVISYIQHPFVLDHWVCLKHPDVCVPSDSFKGVDTTVDFQGVLKEVTELDPSELNEYQEFILSAVTEAYNMEMSVKALRKAELESFVGGQSSTEKARQTTVMPSVVEDLLDRLAEAGSQIEKVTYENIVDQATADAWVSQVFREEKMPDKLGPIFKVASDYHFTAKTFDCVAFILVAGFKFGDTAWQFALESFFRTTEFTKYDSEMAPFNSIIIDAVKNGPTRSLGTGWDDAVTTVGGTI